MLFTHADKGFEYQVAAHLCLDDMEEGIGAQQLARQEDEFLGRHVKVARQGSALRYIAKRL